MVAQLGEQQSQQEGLTWKGKKWTAGEEQNSGMGNCGGAKLLGRRKLQMVCLTHLRKIGRKDLGTKR
jgi:hypothetical protein